MLLSDKPAMLDAAPDLRAIVVYVIDPPPLATPKTGPLFPFLRDRRLMDDGLEAMIGAHDPQAVSLVVDSSPGGPGWETLLEGIRDERVATVITHLAPLTSVQRQQLIGMCALSGVQLVTPGNAVGAPQPVPRTPD